MHRFFVPSDWLVGPTVNVTGPLVQQMARVLRLRPGEHVVFLDNSGWEYESEVTALDRDQVQATVVRRGLASGEPRAKITLYQSLLKGDHFSDVLQKCTELGVVEFVPLVSERCIVGDASEASVRTRRWQRIILEAAEQAQRGKLPVLRPVTMFPAAVDAVAGRGLSLMPWEEERGKTLRAALAPVQPATAAAPAPTVSPRRKPVPPPAPHRPFAINLFIGPEGGFTPQEVATAASRGIIPVTLGPRILRAEMAGLAAAAAILYELGDMG